MEVSLETQELKNGVMRKESSMNSQPSTLRNKMVFVERKNRTLIDMARSMLSEYNVSDSFWAEAINTACHASNRLYCHRFHNKTHMNCLLEGSQISHILECLVANVIFSRRELGYQSSKVNVMKVFFLGINLIARLIGSTTKLMVLLKKHMM